MEIKKIVQSLFFYILSALGISLTIQAMVGVSSFNSLNVALSAVASIKVGTITTIINCGFLILCGLLDKDRSFKTYFVMFAALWLFGNVINLFLYTILKHIVLTHYSSRIFLFIAGTVLAGYGTGRALALELLKFPIEHFCNLLAAKSKYSFKFYRYSIDLICVFASLVLSLSFHLPIYVREGTLISLFLLSYVISWAKEKNRIGRLKQELVKKVST